jgi:hypothetical protein
MQTFLARNLEKYQSGNQIDISIADGEEATSASKFFSLDAFDVQKEPEIVEIPDAQGNRSSSSAKKIGDFNYPFSFGGFVDIEKVGEFIYYATGQVVSTQDGTTGAWEHVFTMVNNVVLPQFTMFYSLDGEHANDEVGYKRLTGCHIQTLSFSGSGSEVKFEGSGWATGEDDVLNSTSNVTGFTVSAIEYQSDGLIRYTLDATDLSGVSNGDVLDTSSATGISNASNIGKFIVVSVDDTSDTIDVINSGRTDDTDDETGLTATGGLVTIITPPTYADPDNVLLMKDACVLDAVDLAGLDAADTAGLSEFNLSIDNNSSPLRERCRSGNPLAIVAGNITAEMTFIQSMNTTSGARVVAYRDAGDGVIRAWEFNLEDQSVDLGTSTTHHPLLRLIAPEALGIGTRANTRGGDLIQYDWALNVQDEQQMRIVLRNETSSYGA